MVVTCVSRLVWQLGGLTPLHIASQTGQVECVLALLAEGATINQAAVGRVCSMSLCRGDCLDGTSGLCMLDGMVA